MKTENKTEPQGELVLRTIAMPSDTNPNGNIFGGWIMSQMDLGGAIMAKETARGRVVTVNVSSISFIKPAMVGDVVCCYARCIKTGKTSVTIAIEVWVKQFNDDLNIGNRFCITEAVFTYVAVDKHNQPKQLPACFQYFDSTKESAEKLKIQC